MSSLISSLVKTITTGIKNNKLAVWATTLSVWLTSKSRRLNNIMFLEVCNKIQRLDNSTKLVDYEILKHIQQNTKEDIKKK